LHISAEAMRGVKYGPNGEEAPPSSPEKLRTTERSKQNTDNPSGSGAALERRRAPICAIAMSPSRAGRPRGAGAAARRPPKKATRPPLGMDAVAGRRQQHPDHQLRIDRGSTRLAAIRLKMGQNARRIDEAIDLAQHAIVRDVAFAAETRRTAPPASPSARPSSREPPMH
jgi:hypothetical protein